MIYFHIIHKTGNPNNETLITFLYKKFPSLAGNALREAQK